MNGKQNSYECRNQSQFLKPAALSLSILLVACGGGSSGDDAGLSARLNQDNSSTTTASGGGATSNAGASTGTSIPTPTNSSLVIELSEPVQPTFASPMTINASVTNAQGTVSYALSGAPEGMVIDSTTGEISWTPSGLNFGKGTQFNYRVSATDDAGTSTRTGSITISNSPNEPMVRSSARVPTKQNAIHIGDFNNDGQNEVLVTDNVALIYTLKWDASLNGGDFYQEWVYPYSLGNQANIDAIDAADVNGDGILDIIVLNGDSVSVIDGASRTLAYSYEIADAVRGYAVLARNIDTDEAIEIVTLVSKGATQEQLNIFTVPTDDSETLNNDWTSAVENYGTAMVIANMDFVDDQLEIATSAGYVFDGVSLRNEWIAARPSYGFGDQLVAADLDGDGIKEIVGLYSDSGIGEVEVFSLHAQSGLFGDLDPVREPETTRCSIAAMDWDGSGADEIFLGECVDSGAAGGEMLDVYSAVDQASFSGTSLYRQITGSFTDDRLHGGFVSLTVGDVDSDGDLEAVWANKMTGDKYNAITVVDLSDSLSNGVMVVARQNTSLALFDTAFTGAVDFLYSPGTRYATFFANTTPAEKDYSSDDNFSITSRFAFIDYDTGRVNISSRISKTNTITAGQKVMAMDTRGAGYDQLILSSGFIDNGSDFTTYFNIDYGERVNPVTESVHGGWVPDNTSTYRFSIGIEGNHSAVFDLANLDADSEPELLGFIGNNLFYYDISPAYQNWQSNRIYGEGIDVKIDDINADGQTELIHLTDTGLYIRLRDNDVQHQFSDFYDKPFLSENLYQGTSFTAMQVVDINTDGQKEIVVSAKTDSGGTIYLLDNSLTLLAEFSIAGEITDFQSGQMDNSVLVAWKTASDAGRIDTAYVSEFAISDDMQTVTEIMRSPALLGAVSPHSMNYTDDNSRLLLGTRFGMYITR